MFKKTKNRMEAWLEGREVKPIAGKPLGKGRKACPKCGATTRSNVLQCKKCDYSFVESQNLKKTQVAIVWPGQLNKKRKKKASKPKAAGTSPKRKKKIAKKAKPVVAEAVAHDTSQHVQGVTLYSEL